MNILVLTRAYDENLQSCNPPPPGNSPATSEHIFLATPANLPAHDTVNGQTPQHSIMVGSMQCLEGKTVLADVLRRLQEQGKAYETACPPDTIRGLSESNTSLFPNVRFLDGVDTQELCDFINNIDVLCVFSDFLQLPPEAVRSFACIVAQACTTGASVLLPRLTIPQTQSTETWAFLRNLLEKRPAASGIRHDVHHGQAALEPGKSPHSVLTFTTLYPNSTNPNFGVFIHERMRRVASQCLLKVVAPIPYFPPIKINSRWYGFSKIPRLESRDGVEIHHPRYFHIPKVLMTAYGFFLYASTLTNQFISKAA